jgi:hypothetical protein
MTESTFIEVPLISVSSEAPALRGTGNLTKKAFAGQQPSMVD